MDNVTVGLEVTGLLNSKPTGIGIYIKNLLIHLTKINVNVKLFYKITRIKNINNLKKISNDDIRWHYKNIYNPFNKKIDIIHVTDNTFLNYRRSPKICTIHDLAVFKNETQIKYYTSSNHKHKISKYIKFVLSKVDAVIAVSDTTKNDLIELFNFPENKVRVISLAPNEFINVNEKVKDKNYFNLKNKGYFLFVGDISVRKNIINILKAYSINYLSNDFQLVLAGSMGMGKDLIEKTILDLNLNSRVKILNYVPNNILYSLYINAAGLIFPTYYEGFGIPILEAMRCKIPFLIGNIGAAPETAGGHGIKVSPFSVGEIGEGIKSLLETTDSQIEAAFRYANKFSWEKNAIETKKFYREILGYY